MASRRKGKRPHQRTEQERNILSWNMEDMYAGTSQNGNLDIVAEDLTEQSRNRSSDFDAIQDGHVSVSVSEEDVTTSLSCVQSEVTEVPTVSVEDYSNADADVNLYAQPDIEILNDLHNISNDNVTLDSEEKSRDINSSIVIPDSFQTELGQHQDSVSNDSIIKKHILPKKSKLEKLLDDSNFYVPVYNQVQVKNGNWFCKLGSFSLNLCQEGDQTFPKFLPDCDEYWLYVSEIPQQHMVYFELGTVKKRPPVFYRVHFDVPYHALESCNGKHLQLVHLGYNPERGQLTLAVYLMEQVLTKLKFPSEAPNRKTKTTLMNSLQHFMKYYFQIPIPEDFIHTNTRTKCHDIEDLFKVVQEMHSKENHWVDIEVQHPGLKPILRPYQKEAVKWMLEREHFGQEDGDGGIKNTLLHSLYQEITAEDGQILYYNRVGGSIVKTKPLQVVSPPGGILADEMGLGKTVEVLACVLLNTRRDLPRHKVGFNTDDIVTGDECSKSSLLNLSSQECTQAANITDVKNLNDCPTEAVKTGERIVDLDTKLVSKVSDNVNSKDDVKSETTGNSEDSLSHVTNVCTGAEDADDIASVGDVPKEPPKKKLKTVGLRKSKKAKPTENDQSQINSHNTQPKNGFTTTVGQKNYFECVCGRSANSWRQDYKAQVQCMKCGLLQHAGCVQYDIDKEGAEQYLCPHCLVSSPVIPSCATLIITPNSISHQWVEEIKKHIKEQSLKVLVYQGVNKKGFIQPKTLAEQDLVITTYETLRTEVNYVDLPHSNSEMGRRFRHPKRFMAIPSPIIAVEWWRICLDEAQMVECTTTKTADMALRLSAVNRWCVSGTPIQKGIEDLYGLLLFLGADPYWVKHWWNKCLYEPYCHGNKQPLQDVVSKYLWRTVKADVLDQIQLPSQTEQTHWLTFSPVEEHFYRRQYVHCKRDAMKNLSKWSDCDMKLSSLDRHTMTQLLYPLLRLRQACCHPQAVKGEFMPIQKNAMTMEKLLETLIKKTKTECEEAHRQLVASLNGLAAIHIIKEEFIEAVEKYREVMISIREHQDELRTDELQQLHTLHNLNEILGQKPAGVAPTLQDDKLSDMAQELREKYLSKAAQQVTNHQESLVHAQGVVRETRCKFDSGANWWMDLLQWVMSAAMDDVLIDRIKDDLLSNTNSDVTSIAYRFRDLRGLQFVTVAQLEQLQNSHENLLTALNALNKPPSQDVINKTVECCLRPVGDIILKNCPFCKTHELFEKYEARLFSFIDRGVFSDPANDLNPFFVGTRRQGTWADSEVERVLKNILTYARNMGGDHELVEYGNIHIKLFDNLKKEFKCLRGLWMALREQIAAIDELDMSTMRLRLRMPEEPVADPPLPYIIEKPELDHHKMKLQSDKVVGQNDLRKHLGQLIYLKNLAKTQDSLEGGSNPEPCPICQKALGMEWSVLQCGHCYCLDCMNIMVDEYSCGGRRRRVKCAICRQPTSHGDISYVSTKTDKNVEEGQAHIPVKGSHSTKVSAVVQCIKQIKLKDPGAKTLVFSTWTDVLDLISKALDENHVQYRSLHAHSKFQINLASFKQNDQISVLLLPVHSGANGLNLIEATHVLLVEPILNPAQELQAVGRVHRIGQTRPTVIHRFLVRGTIEERIQTMQKSMKVEQTLGKDESLLTIRDLSSLFETHHTEVSESP